MAGDSGISRTVVYVNGHRLPFTHALTWDKAPAPLKETVTLIQDPYERRLHIKGSFGSGMITCKGWVNENGSEPQTWMDVMQHRYRYSYYDIATSKVVESSTTYDASDIEDAMLGKPKIPKEIRQVEANGEVELDGDGTYTMVAQSFKAHSNVLTTLKILARDVADHNVATLNVHIYSDSAGAPDTLLTNATVNATGLTFTDGTGYGNATWVSIDIDGINDTTALVVGTTYWLVLEAAENDSLFLNRTSNNRYTSGTALGYSGSWAAISGVSDFDFILQGYDTYGGHTIDIYEYNQGQTLVDHWKCEACDIFIQGPTMNPQEVMSLMLKFSSEQITLLTS